MADRLRLDAARKLCRDHGHDRRLRRCSRVSIFAVNSPAGIVGATPKRRSRRSPAGDSRSACRKCTTLPRTSARQTLFYRTGGAPSLALGMAHIFAQSGGGQAILGFWYHFAIMFEALFILTMIDAGTRVGRFMLQDLLGHVYKPLGRTSWMPGVIVTSARSSAPGDTSCIRACSIRSAASIRCGRCSESRISCLPRSRCASPPRSCSRCIAPDTCGSRACRWCGC